MNDGLDKSPVCKDLAFARNLVAQMKEGYGRHNSSVWRPHFRRPKLDGPWRPAPPPPDDLLCEARVIGVIDGRRVMGQFATCEIGDLVPEPNPRFHISQYLKFMPHHLRACPDWTQSAGPIREIERLPDPWTFELVRFRIGVGRTQWFWKRLD